MFPVAALQIRKKNLSFKKEKNRKKKTKVKNNKAIKMKRES